MAAPLPPTVVNLDLSKAAEKLIETVSNGIGMIFEPWQIKRVAEAEADASIVKAKTEIAIDDLRASAQAWQIEQAMRRQEHILQIIAQALPELAAAGVGVESVDPDWTAQFFTFSQDISNKEMQRFWARLLAGEVAQPGTFSLRTLSALRLMKRADAQLFQEFRKFIWYVGGSPIALASQGSTWITSSGPEFTFDKLLQLDALGLVQLNSVQKKKPVPVLVTYGANEFVVVQDPTARIVLTELSFSGFVPTDVGAELVPLCDFRPIDELRDFWITSGFPSCGAKVVEMAKSK